MNTAELIRAARAADSSGQTGRAEQLCRQALSVEPACADALLIAGSIAARFGRVDEAVDLLKRAASAEPDSYDAERWLATLLIGRAGGKEAVVHAKAAVRLRPQEAEAHVVLGLASLAAGDYAQAISSLKRSVELSPSMAGAYHNLGVAFQNDEQFDEAIEAFKHAIALSPRLIASHLHLGMAHLARDDVEGAIGCAREALAITPSSRSAQKLLVDAHFKALHGDHGEEYIRRAMEKAPDTGFPYALMGNWLQEQGKFPEAEASIFRSIELEPKQGLAYYLLAHNKKFREADRPLVERFEAIARESDLHPGDRRQVYFALGKAYDDLKQFEKAIRNLDLANGEADRPEADGPINDLERFGVRSERYRQFLTRELLNQYTGVGLDSNKPIIIFGMPRSGTTLLEQILSRHSKVGAAGEQSFWRDRRRRLTNFDSRTLNVHEMQSAGQAYLDLLSSIAPGKARVTDKWPSNYMHLALLTLIFPNATFLHTKRHPVDTCLSMYMRPFLGSDDMGGRKSKIVAGYKQYLGLMEHWREVLPDGRFFEVQYEQMVADPERVTREVVAYCGLDWEDSCLSPEAGDRQVKTFSKWQVRQPVYTTSVERWRNYEPWLGEFGELIES